MQRMVWIFLWSSLSLSLTGFADPAADLKHMSHAMLASTSVVSSCYHPPQKKLTLAEQLALAKKQCKDVLLISQSHGIVAYTYQLQPIATITKTSGLFLRLDPTRRYVYFFTHHQLRKIDLVHEQESVVASIPKLGPPFPSADNDGIDPVEFIQQDGDVSFNFRKGYACFNVMDRNENMAEVRINYKVDLTSGKVNFKITMDLSHQNSDDTPSPLCDVISKDVSDTSPSGRFHIHLEEILPEGDYFHHRLFVSQPKENATYAIYSNKLVKVNRSLPAPLADKACSIVSEDHVEWLPRHDTLVVMSCKEKEFEDSTITVIDMKTKTLHHIMGHSFLVD